MATKSKNAEPHVARTTPPKLPGIAEPSAMFAARRIYLASAWTPNLAIMEIKNVRTLNLDPKLASYKAEMLEYLSTKEQV